MQYNCNINAIQILSFPLNISDNGELPLKSDDFVLENGRPIQVHRECPGGRYNFVLDMLIFALKTMNYALKMMNFVLKW